MGAIGGFYGLNNADLAQIAKQGQAVAAPPGARVFEPGKQCELFYLLRKGVIRVQIVAESGREIVLYRVGPGDSCVMTVSCLMSRVVYNGEGIVEQAVEGYAINKGLFNHLFAHSERFRDIILTSYSTRFLDLVNVLENVAFRPLENRLAGRLLQLAGGQGEIEHTHQFLATDLGTAREVVSRLLKKWEADGVLSLGRGTLKIRKPQLLAEMAGKK